jgi:hypothetical protein
VSYKEYQWHICGDLKVTAIQYKQWAKRRLV